MSQSVFRKCQCCYKFESKYCEAQGKGTGRVRHLTTPCITVSPVEVGELPGVEHARQHEGAGVEGARGGGPAYQRRHRAHHRAHPGVEDAVPGALRRSASG